MPGGWPAAEARLQAAVEAWGDRMVRFAHALTADRALAQDVAQETFLRRYLWLRRHPARVPKPACRFTVARNVAFDCQRRRRPSLMADPPAGVEAPEVDQPLAVRATLAKLAAGDRQRLELCHCGALSVAGVARVLGIPAAMVKMRRHRARRRFAALWSGPPPTGPVSGAVDRG